VTGVATKDKVQQQCPYLKQQMSGQGRERASDLEWLKQMKPSDLLSIATSAPFVYMQVSVQCCSCRAAVVWL
jgi:hypothetical protein